MDRSDLTIVCKGRRRLELKLVLEMLHCQLLVHYRLERITFNPVHTNYVWGGYVHACLLVPLLVLTYTHLQVFRLERDAGSRDTT